MKRVAMIALLVLLLVVAGCALRSERPVENVLAYCMTPVDAVRLTFVINTLVEQNRELGERLKRTCS